MGEAKWEIEKVEGGIEVYLLPGELADHIDKLLESSYYSYGGDLWKVIKGFQTRTNCGSSMTNLYLVYRELNFVVSPLATLAFEL